MSRWDVAALLGGGVGAGLWYGWSVMDVKDTRTPMLIMALPVVIVFLRKPIDRLLLPLHRFKRHIPRLVVIGAGLAVPYLVAHLLYAKFGIRNFPLAQKSILWGTVLSYVIMRIPQGGVSAPARPRADTLRLWFGVIWLGMMALADVALGDDFARDRRRLEDGLRTDGAAEVIAGTAATVISVLVNGALVFQRPVRRPPGEGGEDVRYSMLIDTQDRRESLDADGEDRLWIYANITCSKPDVNTKVLTEGIGFEVTGELANWVKIASVQFAHGRKAAQLSAEPPTPEAELPENAKVDIVVRGATAEGDPMEAPVPIELEEEGRIKVRVLA